MGRIQRGVTAVKPVKITDTTLRDAHQSLWATRMRTEDMLPILSDLDDAGLFFVGSMGRSHV